MYTPVFDFLGSVVRSRNFRATCPMLLSAIFIGLAVPVARCQTTSSSGVNVLNTGSLSLTNPSGLTANDMADAVSPKLMKDLIYKTVNGEQIKLDLFIPAGATQPTPLVILIHGGGWVGGNKDGFDGDALRWAKRGYAAASVDYRLTDEAQFPAQIEDVKAAVRWLRAHAQEYNFDPNRFAAMGHSAGGHLAALLGTSGDISRFDVGDNLNFSSKVQAVVDMAGPVDLPLFFAPKSGSPSKSIPLFGGTLEDKKDLVILASPIFHIGADTPPFLIISGLNDTAVGTVQPQLMYAALQKAGIPCQLMLIPGVPHGIHLDLPYGKGQLWDAVYYFLDSVLKKKKDNSSSAADTDMRPFLPAATSTSRQFAH